MTDLTTVTDQLTTTDQLEIIAILQQAVIDIDRLQSLLYTLEDTEVFLDATDFGNAREVLGSINSLKYDLLQRIGEMTLGDRMDGDRMDGDRLGVRAEKALQAWRDSLAPVPAR